MTYKEKLAMTEPDRIDSMWLGECLGCPDDIEIITCPFGGCTPENCSKCWNREIPGTEVAAASKKDLEEFWNTESSEFVFKRVEPLKTEQKIDICSCYREDSRCWGTKEIDSCKCGGDEAKCDFYEYKRDQAKKATLADALNELHAVEGFNSPTMEELKNISDKMTRDYIVSVRVICISGKAQHGKDTTAGYLKEALEGRGYKVLIAHYGDLVKYVCKTFFDWDGCKDEAGRTLLQHVGTDIIRALTPDYWVDFVLSILDHFPDKWDYVLIPDCRFPNEIDRVRSAGWNTTHVRVVRGGDFVSPLTEEQQKHPSETALDNARPDFLVLNVDTLDFLKKYIYEMARYLENDK